MPLFKDHRNKLTPVESYSGHHLQNKKIESSLGYYVQTESQDDDCGPGQPIDFCYAVLILYMSEQARWDRA